MTAERIICCGGRRFADEALVRRVLTRLLELGRFEETGEPLPVVVHGGAPGADRVAARVALELGCDTERHQARWAEHGPAAGPIRNRQMAVAGASVCVAFPGGAGTRSMVEIAREHGIKVLEVGAGGTAEMPAGEAA